MDGRSRTLAALVGAATGVAAGVVLATSIERHLVRGESMVPALRPRDTVLTVRAESILGRLPGRLFAPRADRIAVIALPWEHDLLGVKRLVAGPGQAWRDGDDHVAAGPGWVVVGDQRVLSTDSRHHGRVPTENIRGIVVGRVKPPS